MMRRLDYQKLSCRLEATPVGCASRLQSKRAPFTGLVNEVLCLKYIFVSCPDTLSHYPAKHALTKAKLGTFDQHSAHYFLFS